MEDSLQVDVGPDNTLRITFAGGDVKIIPFAIARDLRRGIDLCMLGKAKHVECDGTVKGFRKKMMMVPEPPPGFPRQQKV